MKITREEVKQIVKEVLSKKLVLWDKLIYRVYIDEDGLNKLINEGNRKDIAIILEVADNDYSIIDGFTFGVINLVAKSYKTDGELLTHDELCEPYFNQFKLTHLN